MVFDTGSSNLWLATGCIDNCTSGYFHTHGSKTYVRSKTAVSAGYGSGSINGTIGRDTISVGGMSVQGQYFMAVTSMSEGQ